MKQLAHRTGAIISTVCLEVFFLSSLFVVIQGEPESIVMVKSLIAMPGLLIFIPAIAVAGATGLSFSTSKSGCIVGQKRKRMPFIGISALLILLPAAVVLNLWASVGSFDNRFYLLQALELVAGVITIVLMIMNIRAGRKLKRK
ncbi:MAG: hypothetical protein KZQ80_11065 [Candidatus Thiodiazotropha sp. (ex Monitilora ramsayi)]|nr:hypothetical protein [Candidatus Thiodiazotropha sp. (ex Monitilora ramsayi)]